MPDTPDWTSAPLALFQARVRQTVTASEAGVSVTLLAVPADKACIVTQISVAAIATGSTALRDQLLARFGYGGGPTIIGDLAISPAAPAHAQPVDAASATVPAGSTIQVQLTTAAGGGKTDVEVTMSYYLGS